jgi:hypothetical protein
VNAWRPIRRLLILCAAAVLTTLGLSAGPALAIVAVAAPTIAGVPTSPVTVGDGYSFSYDVTGWPPLTVSVTSLSGLPDGLVMDGTGHITGNPTTPGSYPFTVTATNGVAPDATIDSTIVVLPQAPTITGTPPLGQYRVPYSFQFTTTGDPTVTLQSGTFPAWATLAPDGTISGTPTGAGKFVFTVVADNGALSTATETVTLVVQPKPRVSIGDASVVEGNTGTRAMTFVVHLSRTGIADVTMHWATANGTARAATDYKAASGSLTIPAGQTTGIVTVVVRGDRLKEPNETLFVNVRGPSHADLVDGQGRGVIVNDD